MAFIDVLNVKTAYQLKGSGQDVVLLHGWRQNMEMMQFIQDYLSAHFRVLNLDFPGFGQSAEPPVSWSVSEYEQHLNALLEALDIHNPILIGHSFGCRVAIKYANDYPVKKMILTGAAGIKAPVSSSNNMKTKFYKTAKKAARLFGGEQGEERIKKHFGSDDYRNATGVMRDTFVKVVNEDLTDYLSGIACPVLLLWGDQDEATPLWMGKKMEELIPDAGLAIFEGDDHFAYFHQPQRFERVLDAFLKNDMEKH